MVDGVSDWQREDEGEGGRSSSELGCGAVDMRARGGGAGLGGTAIELVKET